MSLTHPAWQQTPTPTPHPLQRLGAFSLAALAHQRHPDELHVDTFGQAVETMTEHLVSAAAFAKAKDAKGAAMPGAFWLACGSWLWPNQPGFSHPGNRVKRTASERADAARTWRAPPEPHAWPDADCVLCHRPAVGHYDKTNIPLAASGSYINTTAPGTRGWALCWGCLTSMWAAPYGSLIHAGACVSLVSADDHQQAAFTTRQVRRTRRIAQTGNNQPLTGQFLREQYTVRHIRELTTDQIHAGVQLIVWSNHNQTPECTPHLLDTETVRWLHSTARPDRATAWADLCRVFHTPKATGFAALSTTILNQPSTVPTRVINHLLSRANDTTIPAAATRLTPLITSYAEEVLNMPAEPRDDILTLAEAITSLITADKASGTASPLSGFIEKSKTPGTFKDWLMNRGVHWAKNHPTSGPLFTTRQFELLFSPRDEHTWWWRQLLRAAVVSKLGERGYVPTDDDTAPTDTAQAADFDTTEDLTGTM